jgi:hypothetical protein
MRTSAATVLVVLLAATARAGSESPPPGPPWLRDFSEAQALALREGRPIFVYLTKTY